MSSGHKAADEGAPPPPPPPRRRISLGVLPAASVRRRGAEAAARPRPPPRPVLSSPSSSGSTAVNGARCESRGEVGCVLAAAPAAAVSAAAAAVAVVVAAAAAAAVAAAAAAVRGRAQRMARVGTDVLRSLVVCIYGPVPRTYRELDHGNAIPCSCSMYDTRFFAGSYGNVYFLM